MGLSDNYIALDSYRDNGYPMNGFILIGISFGESSAGLANDNYFGARFGFDEGNSDDVRRLSIGQSQVIGAMRKCNLAFSAKDALNLMETEKFYVKAQGLVAFLQTRIDEKNYDISTNYTSYCRAVANAIDWEKNYRQGFDDAQYFTYKFYNLNEIQ